MKTATARERRVGFLLASLLTVRTFLIVLGAEPMSHTLKVKPRESDELLANPGMGWQTFHRFASEDPNLQGLPSASAYFRFYWREIEPRYPNGTPPPGGPRSQRTFVFPLRWGEAQ